MKNQIYFVVVGFIFYICSVQCSDFIVVDFCQIAKTVAIENSSKPEERVGWVGRSLFRSSYFYWMPRDSKNTPNRSCLVTTHPKDAILLTWSEKDEKMYKLALICNLRAQSLRFFDYSGVAIYDANQLVEKAHAIRQIPISASYNDGYLRYIIENNTCYLFERMDGRTAASSTENYSVQVERPPVIASLCYPRIAIEFTSCAVVVGLLYYFGPGVVNALAERRF